jgi:hypothetical protein
MGIRNRHYVIIGVIFLLLMLTAIYIRTTDTVTETVFDFDYDDSYQRRVANVIMFEYMGLDGAIPEKFNIAYEKDSDDDILQCFSFMGGMAQSHILSGAECNNPEYWKYYHYTYAKSSVGVGYLIFENAELADEYLSSTAETLELFIMRLQLQGGRVESKVIVYPAEFGHALDDYAIISIVMHPETGNQSYIMVSLLREGNTVYTIFERSTQEILNRKLYFSFTPEMHESYLRRQPVMLDSLQ